MSVPGRHLRGARNWMPGKSLVISVSTGPSKLMVTARTSGKYAEKTAINSSVLALAALVLQNLTQSSTALPR